jgi:hypothetical protein
VIAGLALAGSLLVGLVLAKARHERQWDASRRRIAAAKVADELLAGWWAQPGSMPVQGEGVTESTPEMAWRTQAVHNADVELLGGRVVRLELRPDRASDDAPPPISVEIVVPGDQRGGT